VAEDLSPCPISIAGAAFPGWVLAAPFLASSFFIPSLHRCSLSFAVVIQFGDPSIVLALVYYGVALCCVIASRTKRKIGQ
jgi:hypothetical protein